MPLQSEAANMSTLLFVTEPEQKPEQLERGTSLPWSCSHSTRAGDGIWVWVTGGKGLCFQWRAVSDSQPDPKGKYRWVCNVEWVSNFIPPISLIELRNAVAQTDWNPPHVNMRVRAATTIPDCVVKKISALRPVKTLLEVQQQLAEAVDVAKTLAPEQRLQKLASAPKRPRKIKVGTEVFDRNAYVIAEVLIRAQGVCEFCKQPAPFQRATNGEPYLEVHHKQRLADGGEDTIENAVAICPNCHRKAHYG